MNLKKALIIYVQNFVQINDFITIPKMKSLEKPFVTESFKFEEASSSIKKEI